MGSDVAFAGCRDHAVCQDYALSGIARFGDVPGSWAVVSDGCSSEPHTDVGARLLAHAAARQIHDLAELPAFESSTGGGWVRSVVQSAQAVADAMRLPSGALCATLSVVTTDSAGDFRVLLAGDGVIVARYRTGGYLVHRYQFKNEMPFYPVYLTRRSSAKEFAEAAGDACLTHHWTTVSATKGEGPLDRVWFNTLSYLHPYPYLFGFSALHYDAVAVLTDGADAVRHRPDGAVTDETVPLADVVRSLCGYKGLQGAFVQRRFRGAMKEFDKAGWRLGDDLTVGAVSVELESDEIAV